MPLSPPVYEPENLADSPVARGQKLGRPADRQEIIVEALRARIVAGELAPGSLLPTRLEIEKAFAASPITVQRALERLKSEGFVTAHRGTGTFVSPQPPHLSRFAVIFPSSPTGKWVGFFAALAHEAGLLSEKGRQLPLFYDVNGHRDSEDDIRLLADVQQKRVAGLIFVTPPVHLRDGPLFEDPALPRVVVGSSNAGSGAPIVNLDTDSFWQQAIAAVSRAGRRQVAFLLPPGCGHYRPFIEATLKENDLTTQPHWWQVSHQKAPESARQIALLLFHPEQTTRPDALIIADDNLVEAATQGLCVAGIEDVTVVAHCNFPLPTPAEVPVIRLGFDAREILEQCLHILEAQRQKQPVEAQTMAEARLEEL